MSKLIMIIGVPGSGKTTKANEIIENYVKNNLTAPENFEADMWFCNNANHEYKWFAAGLRYAHAWCYNKVEESLKNNFDVIVSNTSSTIRDRNIYIKLAKQYNADIEVITANGNYNNIHGIPNDKIEILKNKFQPFDKSELNI